MFECSGTLVSVLDLQPDPKKRALITVSIWRQVTTSRAHLEPKSWSHVQDTTRFPLIKTVLAVALSVKRGSWINFVQKRSHVAQTSIMPVGADVNGQACKAYPPAILVRSSVGSRAPL